MSWRPLEIESDDSGGLIRGDSEMGAGGSAVMVGLFAVSHSFQAFEFFQYGFVAAAMVLALPLVVRGVGTGVCFDFGARGIKGVNRRLLPE